MRMRTPSRKRSSIARHRHRRRRHSSRRRSSCHRGEAIGATSISASFQSHRDGTEGIFGRRLRTRRNYWVEWSARRCIRTGSDGASCGIGVPPEVPAFQ